MDLFNQTWRKQADLTGCVIRKHFERVRPATEETAELVDLDALSPEDREKAIEENIKSPTATPEVAKGLVLDSGQLRSVPIPKTNLEKRQIRLTLSTEKMDRQGDTVAADGWKLDEYAQNGVVLWSHQNIMLPVAKNVGIGVVGRRLQQAVQFAETQMAEDVFQLYAGDFLRAWSAGFQPMKWETREKPFGFDFKQQTLLESSAVNVPANPDALAVQAGMGLISDEVMDSLDLRKELGERLEKIERKLDEGLRGLDSSYLDGDDLAAAVARRIAAWQV